RCYDRGRGRSRHPAAAPRQDRDPHRPPAEHSEALRPAFLPPGRTARRQRQLRRACGAQRRVPRDGPRDGADRRRPSRGECRAMSSETSTEAERSAAEAAVRSCYSTWAESYFADYYANEAAYPPVHQKIIRDLVAASGAHNLLDAGCGP